MIEVGLAEDSRPNVVMIIVDDLNDLPLSPDGKPVIKTPNIDRIARRGVTFTNAHCNDPICAPSRASMLFGLYPQTSGLYWFEKWKENGVLNQCVSLNRHLQSHGYSVFGTGKIYHGGQSDGAFDQRGPKPDVGPWPWDGKSNQSHLPHPAMMYLYDTDGDMDYKWEHHFGPLSMIPDWKPDPQAGIPGYKGWRLGGKPFRYNGDDDRDKLADERCAEWSAGMIAAEHDRPFAIFTGLVRTHTPLYAPQEYFDRFPIDSIELPETIEGDLDDCATALADPSLYGFRRYNMLVRHKDRQLYKQWLQAYLACVSFVDDQVGKILDAVDASPERDNTIVIFTSDHGFHMGEKEFLYKQSLWDGATRIPLIIAGVDGMPQGVTCDRPVSWIDLYPTLNELCGLPREPNAASGGYKLQGHSLVPLVMSPDGDWDGPDVAITALPGKDHSQHERHGGTWFPHFSVRSKQYRYTLCASGEEELYDFDADPREWTNLANDPAYAAIKASLKDQLIALRDGPNWKSLDDLHRWTYGAQKGGVASEDGTLTFSGHSSSYLATIAKYKNFEWEFEAKSPDTRQMRISYHARVKDNRVAGTVVNVPPTASNLQGNAVPFTPGQWNRYRIRVVGGRCQVWINGRLHSDRVKASGDGLGVFGIDFPGAAQPTLSIRAVRVRPL
ncbi:Choline-sulfatase [Stieleria neptunia]|uniref:Choline-sulfatase n=1 Tax=Stieleria neptunia TaxID=2527979 RepID=A0A518HIQ9_9BACT|nr:sulfatase-like hydrolase/transferase [Stieleria neptunia]QDV40738.1 Choline-sulfatase [Stieleria neptunia]